MTERCKVHNPYGKRWFTWQRAIPRLLASSMLAWQSAAIAAGPPDTAKEVFRTVQTSSLRRFDVQDLRAVRGSDQRISFNVSLGGASQQLDLEPLSLRASGFRVLVEQPDGTFETAAAPPIKTYRGRIASMPDSRVAASVGEDGSITAMVRMHDGSSWFIEPVRPVVAGVNGRLSHVVYRGEDAAPSAGLCGGPIEDPNPEPKEAPPPIIASTTSSATLHVCDIAFDADNEFFLAHNSSADETVADIEAIVNGMAMLYETEAGITYELASILVRTSEPDPYTSSAYDTLLTQFLSEWNSHQGGVHRDIAHLMTGKDIINNTIGVAYPNTMCQTCGGSGYGLSQSQFTDNFQSRVCLTAHEVGHNWGANHCDANSDCGLMCSVINGCSQPCTHIDAPNLAIIQQAAATLSCISTSSPPLAFPFCDTFDGGINTGAWSYNAGAAVSTSAFNPPSPPYALRLDDCCTDCANGPDELRANFMLLGGVAQAVLWYSTEHTGGSSTGGSQLVVEYFNDQHHWIELNRIVSNGIDQTHFDAWSHFLPADALHDEFRVRFRIEAVSTSDVWYVDDVAVGADHPQSPILYVRKDVVAGGDGSTWATALEDLQDALMMASCSGGTVQKVHVAEGTYLPDRGSGDRSLSFHMPNNVLVLGGFANDATESDPPDHLLHETILSGDIGLTGMSFDNAYHVVLASGVGTGAILDGFTVSGGTATNGPSDSGGGIRVVSGTPIIRNCRITGNKAQNGGGASITSNGAALFLGGTFDNDSADGSGGAVYVGSACALTLDHCGLYGNHVSTFGGGVHNAAGIATIRNSVFSGNTGVSGAAIYNLHGTVIVDTTTFSRNSATSSVGGILNSSANAQVSNSILWGNSDASGMLQGAQYSGTVGTINYSCVQGWTGGLGGTGNFVQDPLFADADGADNLVGTLDDDLRPIVGSPVINAGDPAFFPIGTSSTDFLGNPRVECQQLDMGAYEFGLAFDYDCNGVVGGADLVGLTSCLLGPADTIVDQACTTFDVNNDGRVDLLDIAEIQLAPGGLAPQ